MKSVTYDQVKRMKEICDFLVAHFSNEEKLEEIIENFEDLLDLISNLDQAKNFAKIGGVQLMLDFAMNKQVAVEI